MPRTFLGLFPLTADASPLETVSKELDEAKADRKKITDQLKVLFEQKEVLQKEIDELKTDIENRKKVVLVSCLSNPLACPLGEGGRAEEARSDHRVQERGVPV